MRSQRNVARLVLKPSSLMELVALRRRFCPWVQGEGTRNGTGCQQETQDFDGRSRARRVLGSAGVEEGAHGMRRGGGRGNGRRMAGGGEVGTGKGGARGRRGGGRRRGESTACAGMSEGGEGGA